MQPLRRVAFYAVFAAVVGVGMLAQGCEQGATRPVTTARLSRVRLDTRLDMQVAAALRVRAEGRSQHALVVPEPVRVVVTVEAADIGQLRAEVTLPASSIEVVAPRGMARVITLRYLDSSGNVLGFGQASVDLTQDAQTVTLSIVSALPGITIGTTSAPAVAVRGQSITVSSEIVNNGSDDIRVDQAGHRFRTLPGLTDATPSFADLTVSPALPFTVAAGARLTYAHTSSISTALPAGTYQVDGVLIGARGTETYGLRVSTMPATVRILANRTQTDVAGTGAAATSGDMGPATAAGVKAPVGVTVGPAGDVFISTDQTIRRIATDGTITTVAGAPGMAGMMDGPPPTPVFSEPRGISAVSDGTKVLVADRNNNRIRQVALPGGFTNTAAGGGAGFGGDGAVATATSIALPEDVLAVPGTTDFYYTDTGNHVVRLVSGGTVRTVAGRPFTPGASGDGGPATAAFLDMPRALALDGAGNLLIGHSASNGVPSRGVVRRVDSMGVITTIAGSTDPAAAVTDGVAATASALEEVHGLAFDPAGNLYISTQGATGRVRLVTPEGIIVTIATGLALPERLAAVPAMDALLIALAGENKVRRLE